jgi:signal peptidase I
MQPIQYFLIVSMIALFIALYKIFEKAGAQGWKGLIPIYNFVIWLRILKKPWWWIFLLLIPTISWLMLFILFVETSKAFGKKTLTDHLLALFGYFIYMPYLAFTPSQTWQGPPDESKKKRTIAREWGEAGLFAVVAATIIRTFFFEAFTIPTSSLEKSLLVGDYLFVSKVSYGAKVPNTPLSFPFAHNTMPLSDRIPSYLNWVKLPNFRLPGLGKVERNDYVVFNWPEGDTVELHHIGETWTNYYTLCRRNGRNNVLDPTKTDPYGIPMGDIVVRPIDKLDNYVKRCVALPGDKFEIKNKAIFINDQPGYVPPNLQFNYWFNNDSLHMFNYGDGGRLIATELALKLDISEPRNPDPKFPNIIIVQLTDKNAAYLKETYGQSVIKEETDMNYDDDIFPHSRHFMWSKDNFGPLVIPKEGVTVQLDSINLPIYERIISVYDENKLEKRDGKIIINGQETHSYTFKQNYYFMMGDNRHNSADSRYWGFVPDDHIVGKPVFIWMSLKKDVPFLKKFRWSRFFTFVQSDHISRSYLLYFLIIGGGIWAFFNYRGKKKNTVTSKEILNKGTKK